MESDVYAHDCQNERVLFHPLLLSQFEFLVHYIPLSLILFLVKEIFKK